VPITGAPGARAEPPAGSRGRAPGQGLGAKPPEAERHSFFRCPNAEGTRPELYGVGSAVDLCA